MRERAIVLSGVEVLAIIAGRKTQMRRIVKPQPRQRVNGCMYADDWSWPRGGCVYTVSNRPNGPSDITDDCPHGVPGDRLWVKETWWRAHRYPATMPSGEPEPSRWTGSSIVHYAADGDPPNVPNRHYPNGLRNGAFAAPDPYASWHKHPSTNMPRWASRITLEVTGVRVERLQSISDNDAYAEGIEMVRGPQPPRYGVPGLAPSFRHYTNPDFNQGQGVGAVHSFRTLWESVKGEESWKANPWVWVVEFKWLAQPSRSE